MKKVSAFILFLMLLYPLISINAASQVRSEKYNKIDDDLLNKFSELNEKEALSVWLWFTDIDQTEKEKRIEEISGLSLKDVEDLKKKDYKSLEEFNAWFYPYEDCRNKVESALYKENNCNAIEPLQLDSDSIVFISLTTPCVIVNLTKRQLDTALETDSIMEIYEYSLNPDASPPVVNSDYFYYDRLENYIERNADKYFNLSSLSINKYEELFYHKLPDDSVDWVLVNAHCGSNEMFTNYSVIGNRVLIMGRLPVFCFGMALYDVNEDVFYDLSKISDLKRYTGLREAIDVYGKGRLLGDIDADNELTIIDCTFMQRCATRVLNYPDDDLIYQYCDDPVQKTIVEESLGSLRYYSDFDRDGERDIVDATKLQRYVTYID